MKLMNLLRNWARSLLPIWSYGLECQVCKMTFATPEAHHRHARLNRTIKQHQGKIPVLRCKK